MQCGARAKLAMASSIWPTEMVVYSRTAAQSSMIERLREAIQPTRVPARLYAFDMELVVTVFSYPRESSDEGNSGSMGLMEWNKGRYTSSAWIMIDFSRAISTISSSVD